MDYILFDLQIRRQSLTDLSPGRPIQKDFRATTFEGTTSQALVVFYNPPGCVHVLDPQYDSEIYRLPDWILRALPLSNPQKWITDSPSPAVPPIDLMGSEPKRRWCYYYQKAELARQKQDWQSIVDLEDQSIQVGLRPNDPSEYLPFIEGYARTGKLDDAIEMTQSTYLEARDLQPALCAIWQRSSEAGIEIGDKRRKQIQNILLCPIP